MLELGDHRWTELRHAYGEASDTPGLLRELATFPPDDDLKTEPYFTLWSSLCHQGDVYSASYAALPHLVSALETPPGHTSGSVLQLVACIEIARAQGNGPPMPPDLATAYHDALARVPALLASSAASPWEEPFTRVAAAALAAAKGQPDLAATILELDDDTLPDLMEWLEER